MKSITQQAAPNIIAGVNFNEDRFRELFAWMSAVAADSVAAILQPRHYGLVIPFDGKTALDCQIINQVIVVNRCSGITAKGSAIGIFEEVTPILKSDLPTNLQKDKPYLVVIEVHPNQRLAFGATAKDAPERPKFSMPKYVLEFRNVEDMTAIPSDFLPIGLLQMEGKEWILGDYVPPCLHLGAIKSLREKYLEYQEELQKLLVYLPNVIQQTDNYQDRATLELREFCVQTGSYLAQQAPAFRNLGNYGNPYEMIKIWSGWAGLATFILRSFREDARREFYDLLAHNTHGVAGLRFNPNHFESFLQEFSAFQFQQNELLESVEKVDELLQMIVPLFRILSTNYVRPRGASWNETRKPEPPVAREQIEEKPIPKKKSSSPFSW